MCVCVCVCVCVSVCECVCVCVCVCVDGANRTGLSKDEEFVQVNHAKTDDATATAVLNRWTFRPPPPSHTHTHLSPPRP